MNRRNPFEVDNDNAAAEIILAESVKFKYQQKFQAALQMATQCIQLYPNYYNGYFQRALTLQECKKVECSIRDFFKCIEILESIARDYSSCMALQQNTSHDVHRVATSWIHIVRGWIYFTEHNQTRERLRNTEMQLEEFKRWARDRGMLDDLMREKSVTIRQADMLVDDPLNDENSHSEGEDEEIMSSDEMEQEWQALDEQESKRRQAIQENREQMDQMMSEIQGFQGRCRELVNCAKRCFETAANMAPDISYAHFSLGYILEAERQFSASITAFKRALECEPRYSRCSIYNNMAWCWSELGEWGEAMNNYRLAIGEYGQFVRAYLNMARLQRDMGCFEQAEQAYRQIMRINRTHVYSHLELGDMFMFDIKDENKAVALFHRCKALLDTEEAYPYMILAMVAAFRHKDYHMAIREISAGIDWCKDPMNLRNMLNKRATFYRAIGDVRREEEDERIARLFVDSRYSRQFKQRMTSLTVEKRAFCDLEIITTDC